MNFKKLFVASAVVLGFAIPGQTLNAQIEKSKRPRVAVLEFPAAKNAYEGWNWWGQARDSETRTASVIQDLFVTEL